MTHEERARFADAVRFALEAHGEQKRKGTQVPYVSHLLQVAGLVLEHGGDADQAIAGLLHDAIEDCERVDAETIGDCFGPDVARIVAALSDVLPGDSPGAKSEWLERKRAYLERVHGADLRTRLVCACDKLHNLRTLVADLHAEGTGTLERFRSTPEEQRWYFHEVRRALGPDLPEKLRVDLDEAIAEFESQMS